MTPSPDLSQLVPGFKRRTIAFQLVSIFRHVVSGKSFNGNLVDTSIITLQGY